MSRASLAALALAAARSPTKAMRSSRISTAWAVGAAATPVWIGPPWIRMSPASACSAKKLGARLAEAIRAARVRMRRTRISRQQETEI
jgi:hypothetical protein